MTDAEKIACMVEWMGEWPDHKGKILTLGHSALVCLRCWEQIHDTICDSWNPFERIEDAFLLLDRFGDARITLRRHMGSRSAEVQVGENHGWTESFDSFSRAIAEAAWQVISRLNPDRGSG